jgi:hypothetical protein
LFFVWRFWLKRYWHEESITPSEMKVEEVEAGSGGEHENQVQVP